MAARKQKATSSTSDTAGDDRKLAAEAIKQARAALRAYEHRIADSAERTEGRVAHYRDDVKAAVRKANTDDALVLRKVDAALGSSQKERAGTLAAHKAVADDLLADLAALAEILG